MIAIEGLYGDGVDEPALGDRRGEFLEFGEVEIAAWLIRVWDNPREVDFNNAR